MDNGLRFILAVCTVIVLGGIWNNLPDIDPKYRCTGRTSLSTAYGTGGEHSGDNYAVYDNGQYIFLITGLWPAEIRERDGQLVRVSTVWARGHWPIRTYRPVTPEERALWLQYFKLTGEGQSVWY